MIPENPDYRLLTVDEIVSATRGHTVSHMTIIGDIPPVDKIAPHLKQLRLGGVSNRDRNLSG